ncbi:hypothetical protein LX36DRAFT_229981 [Colletotrichum falcatum]|nr:hypothetical protein LX36DRAFT_229981 [Colletotrichum falcatum]
MSHILSRTLAPGQPVQPSRTRKPPAAGPSHTTDCRTLPPPSAAFRQTTFCITGRSGQSTRSASSRRLLVRANTRVTLPPRYSSHVRCCPTAADQPSTLLPHERLSAIEPPHMTDRALLWGL